MELTEGKLIEACKYAYDKAVSNVPMLGSAEELANDYLKDNNDVDDAINSLIRWQSAKSASAGFITGLGGIITLPIAIPADLASLFYVQLRMIAAIAYMKGYDIYDDRVKTFSFICLCGSASTELLRDIGIKFGQSITRKIIESISADVILKINQLVGFRLLTKFGTTGIVNLGKAIPFIGGIINAGIDSTSTFSVGKAAKSIFKNNANLEND